MVIKQLYLPLDDEGFFRRECPFCSREFKVHLKEDELGRLSQYLRDNFLVERNKAERDSDEDADEGSERYYCPYCGQYAPPTQWWTEEQLVYARVVAANVMADMVNEQLVRPLKRMGHGSIVRIEANEMKKKDEWISPEVSDMTIVPLPCCERRLRIADDWTGPVHCFFCGFPHTERPDST